MCSPVLMAFCSSWCSARGKLVVPVDWPSGGQTTGPGAPCRDKLHWVQIMLDGRVAAFRRRGVALPPPIIVADSWFGDSKLMHHVATAHQGTFLVEGKSTYVFDLPDGRHQRPRLAAWRLAGGIASRCLACAMHGCEPPVRPMVR